MNGSKCSIVTFFFLISFVFLKQIYPLAFNSQSQKKLTFKIIYAEARSDNSTTVYDILKEFVELRSQFPDFLIGFDLVDEEDRFNSLLYYLDDFLNIADYVQQKGLPPIKYFFHAGETDWEDKFNLFDAILLNTTRIGHGYALKHYPLLLEIVKSKLIALEVNDFFIFLEESA